MRTVTAEGLDAGPVPPQRRGGEAVGRLKGLGGATECVRSVPRACDLLGGHQDAHLVGRAKWLGSQRARAVDGVRAAGVRGRGWRSSRVVMFFVDLPGQKRIERNGTWAIERRASARNDQRSRGLTIPRRPRLATCV